MNAEEHLKLLRALCKGLEAELNAMIDDPDPLAYDFDDAASIACKLYDAIMDPEEAKP